MNDPTRRVDLTDCDREPIHVPGSIQAHGSLVALNDEGQVVAWSEDLEPTILAVSDRPATLTDVIGDADAERLAPLLTAGESRPFVPVPLPATDRKALVHRNAQGFAVVEFEQLDLTYEQLAMVLRQAQEVTQHLRRVRHSDDLSRSLASAVRDLTGFDRVMVYRFAEDWHGWVVAESRDPEVESFLGIHFPASDIPAQARALYERNPLRLIVDVDAPPTPLRSRAEGPDPLELDLSDAVLRSVSPIHLQYLRNMEVGASMSISLLRGGQLWGMVACHHRSARTVPFEVRQACELLSQFVSGDMELHDELERSRESVRVREVIQNLAEHLLPESALDVSLGARIEDLREIVRADALVLSTEGHTEIHDATADPSAVESWLRELPVGDGDEPWASHELLTQNPGPFDPPMAGALVVRTTDELPTTIAWLRHERVRTLQWAGDPDKPVVRGEDGVDRLHPRESFSLWAQEQRGTSPPWTESELEAARELKTLILSPSIRTAFKLGEQAQELSKLNSALATSNEELERFAYVASHDLRAPLRAVRNIVEWLTEDESENLSEQAHEYFELLQSRVDRMDQMMIDLLAYARAGREAVEAETLDLDELVDDIFESVSCPAGFDMSRDQLPELDAPHVPVRQILLNLVTNAIKHHDRSQGHVTVRARHDEGGLLLLVEDDGPGIPLEHRGRVFEMFTTLSSRDVVEGSGIGLPLVRRYARSLGGDAWVEKLEPRGTRVVVRLIPEDRDE